MKARMCHRMSKKYLWRISGVCVVVGFSGEGEDCFEEDG